MERLPQGTRRLAVQLRTPLGLDLLWNVLTDYDQLSNFIPNLEQQLGGFAQEQLRSPRSGW